MLFSELVVELGKNAPETALRERREKILSGGVMSET